MRLRQWPAGAIGAAGGGGNCKSPAAPVSLLPPGGRQNSTEAEALKVRGPPCSNCVPKVLKADAQ